jgi:hypothetical protein
MEIDEIESRIQELSSQPLTELETGELLQLLKIAVEYHSNNDLIDLEAHQRSQDYLMRIKLLMDSPDPNPTNGVNKPPPQ